MIIIKYTVFENESRTFLIYLHKPKCPDKVLDDVRRKKRDFFFSI